MDCKVCNVCRLEKPTTDFEKNRKQCRKCIYEKKKAANVKDKDKNNVSPPDACTQCGCAFDPDKFTWRSERGAWRTTCRACSLSSAKSAEYRNKRRERDEEAYKQHQREYMKQYRAMKSLKPTNPPL
jgi:hypothetical protein